MHLVYIDESKDTSAPARYVYSALCIHESVWRDIFYRIRDLRRQLKDNHGIYIREELHAWKFVAGKGQIANRPIYKPQRADIFREILTFIAGLGGNHQQITLFNSINSNEEWAFERLINRINRTMTAWDSRAALLFDEGQEVAFTKRIRKMGVINPIPSRFGVWQDTGNERRNIVIDRIIEDPIFKNSEQSYFIQMVDFCAYALMRQEKQVTGKNALGIHQTFNILLPICFKGASPKDAQGVIR